MLNFSNKQVFAFRSEFGSIYRCSSAVIAYIATQILKLILIATLSIKSTILDHIIDCIGLHYVLINQHKASPAQVKILGKFNCLIFM